MSTERRQGRKGGGRALLGALAVVVATTPGTRLEGQVPPPAGAAATSRAPATAPAQEVLTLERAVRLALERNPEVRRARLQLEEANEQVSEAWGNLWPTLDFTGDYTQNLKPQVNFLPARIFDPTAPEGEFIRVQFGADNTWNAGLALEQPLFNAGVFLGVGAAGRFEGLQEEVLRGRVQAVVTGVRNAYFDLLLAQEQARLTENSVRRVEQSLDETRALERAGLASEYDALRLEVELANLESTLLRALNAVRQARLQLGVALDADDPLALDVAGSLASMDLADPQRNAPVNAELLAFAGVELDPELGGDDVERLLELAMAARSDLRQLELTESLRTTELRLEQVEYLPRVALFGNYTYNAQDFGSPDFFGGNTSESQFVGVRVTWPLFQGFQRAARIGQRRAALASAREQTAFARDQAEAQVRALVDQVVEARARSRAQQLAVSQATRGFDIARAQFREGIGGQLELTDAEVALRQSEFNYAQAVYDYLLARARLDEAVGRVPLVERALPPDARVDPVELDVGGTR